MLGTKTNIPKELSFDARQLAEAFAHIEQLWPDLTITQKGDEGTLIGLPYDYVVPSIDGSGDFAFREMYYWDSYFIALGLLTSGHDELASGILENMMFLAKRYHMVPNASRTYFTSRSQPPFMTTFIFDIYDKQEKDEAWLKEHLHVAEREYHNVWASTAHPHWRNVFEGLSRYYDINVLDHLAEAESGWDMTTRFQGKCLSYIPIDLNCLLYKYEIDFARGASIAGDQDRAEVWLAAARKRAATVTEFLWNESEGFFFDYDYMTQQHSPVWSLAPFFALWSGLATKEQAERLVSHLEKFMHPGGLATTKNPDEWFGDIPTQWAYPNGWAPLHWIVSNGLNQYGFEHEAQLVARTWIHNNLDHFRRNNVFREAYNVVNPELPPKPGLYPPQIGFGWTNAVFIDLAKKFLNEDELTLV